MHNSGTSTWGSGYQLVFVGGDQMGALSAVSVPTTAPGSTADISVSMTAPSSPGTYQGNWRMRNAQGVFFGDTIWVRVLVQSPGSHITVLSFDPPSPSNAQLVRIHAKAEGVPNFRAMRLKIDSGVVYELGAPEFTFDWDTSGYADGDHSVVVEVADWSDLSWSHPERRGATYTLLGGRTPTNHAPNKPSPASPYDWWVCYPGCTLQLCASHNGDPDGDAITGYYFDIYESAQLWNSGWVSSNCVNPTGLGYYTYKWRVKVRDSRGAESDWSDSWHFTIESPDIAFTDIHFDPSSPSDAEEVRTYACTKGRGGVGITLRVSVNDANDGSDRGQWHIIKELGVPCFNDVDVPRWQTLPFADGPHLVKFEARDPTDTDWRGAVVEYRTYELRHRKPASPELVGPGYQAYGQPPTHVWLNSRTITFNWKVPVVNASQFILRARTDSNLDLPGNLVEQPLGTDQNSFTYTFGDDHPDIWWMVRATNDRGYNDSARWWLGIDRVPPSSAVQPLPEAVADATFRVAWGGSDDRSGIATYDVQVRDGERGEWTDWLVGTEATFALFSGQNGHTYYFRARALDKAGNLGTYAGGDGDTHTRVDPTIVPPPPWWNASYQFRRNIVVLNNDSNTLPTGYPLHLHLEGGVASDVYNASRSDGNDVRIVADNSQELDRVVERFTSSAIDIWFRAQSPLASGAADSATYQLYYGNPAAGTPPGSRNSVYHPAADANTVGLWYMYEGSGLTLHDTSGYGNHGTIDGTTTWVTPAKFSGALHFLGGTDGPTVNCGSSSSLNLQNFTVEMFLRRAGTAWGRLAGQLQPNSQRWLMGFRDNGRIYVQFWCTSGGDTIETNRAINDTNWHHVAFSVSGDTARIYLDGQLEATRQLPSNIRSDNLPFTIGSAENIQRAFAEITHVRFSNTTRTSFPDAALVSIQAEPSLGVGDATTYQPPAPPPDLAVESLTTYPDSSGGTLIEAIVTNQGAGPTQNGFWIDLYADHQPTGPGDLTGSIRYWVASPIEAGTTLTLTTVLTEGTVSGSGLAIQTTGSQETTQTLYAQADSTGVLSESDEGNNISSGVEVCFASADSCEPDDAVASARLISVGTTEAHNFDAAGDQDWFKFNARAGVAYTIQTSNLGTSADTYLYLYDADGATLLAANDDYGGTLASRITWRAPTDGTYYVMVKHWNPNVGGCGTSYNVSVALFGDFEPNCIVDIADIMQVASRWRARVGDASYHPTYDLDEDGDIDIVDLMLVVKQWGETCP